MRSVEAPAQPNPALIDPAEIEAMTAEEALRWAHETFEGGPRIAVSFQKTSSVIIDIAHGVNPKTDFFYLDTSVLFPETYETRDRLSAHYGIRFRRHAGISLEEQAELHGDKLWARSPESCCGIRKVEPMREALRGAQCWVSGIRRVDSQTRAGAAKFGWDKRFGLWRLNPIADWTDEQVEEHLIVNNVPYNPLHDQGYPSIGCTHCTSKPAPGEHSRAGRWAGLDKTECGLHG